MFNGPRLASGSDNVTYTDSPPVDTPPASVDLYSPNHLRTPNMNYLLLYGRKRQEGDIKSEKVLRSVSLIRKNEENVPCSY